MNIYLASSIRGSPSNRELIQLLIAIIEKENIGKIINKNAYFSTSLTDGFIYNRDIQWIKESDIILAEVSTPSLGVGYEICYSEYLKKKVICIYQEKTNLSAMIKGNPNLIKIPYLKITNADSQIFSILKEKIKSV